MRHNRNASSRLSSTWNRNGPPILILQGEPMTLLAERPQPPNPPAPPLIASLTPHSVAAATSPFPRQHRGPRGGHLRNLRRQPKPFSRHPWQLCHRGRRSHGSRRNHRGQLRHASCGGLESQRLWCLAPRGAKRRPTAILGIAVGLLFLRPGKCAQPGPAPRVRVRCAAPAA